jgi:hypothetical protein
MWVAREQKCRLCERRTLAGAGEEQVKLYSEQRRQAIAASSRLEPWEARKGRTVSNTHGFVTKLRCLSTPFFGGGRTTYEAEVCVDMQVRKEAHVRPIIYPRAWLWIGCGLAEEDGGETFRRCTNLRCSFMISYRPL